MAFRAAKLCQDDGTHGEEHYLEASIVDNGDGWIGFTMLVSDWLSARLRSGESILAKMGHTPVL